MEEKKKTKTFEQHEKNKEKAIKKAVANEKKKKER